MTDNLRYHLKIFKPSKYGKFLVAHDNKCGKYSPFEDAASVSVHQTNVNVTTPVGEATVTPNTASQVYQSQGTKAKMKNTSMS